MRFVVKRCGVCFSPPSIVLIYENKENKVRKRVIPVRHFYRYSNCSLAAESLKNHPRHKDYLESVSQIQLERLYVILRDHLQGFTLEHSLASLQVDPDEDMNKLGDEELARKKSQMDEVFEKNRTHREDPDFVYDLEVDFSKTAKEKCSWDEDSDDGF
ncbi:centrosomal protein of 19 kDa [Dunckerocampus dactyliophorus]|uniref:centrosomal protein of 19 kDa n=1 Tax=Dunckerocampus dactyliophorus TaxID=161453 RepID=UPI0024057F38|nr:centrosomal protein of 19 kDa [Dunckerocampus dactyliophorus]